MLELFPFFAALGIGAFTGGYLSVGKLKVFLEIMAAIAFTGSLLTLVLFSGQAGDFFSYLAEVFSGGYAQNSALPLAN